MARALSLKEPATADRRVVLYSLSEQIAERIAEDIVNEAIPPGHRLKEADLSRIFGVSRASIREGLRMLETRGLVQIEARRGAKVTELSAEEVDDLYEIRASLLALAARRIAARADPALIAKLEVLLAQLERFSKQTNHGSYFETTYSISNLIAEGAQSRRLSSLIRSFSQQVARYTRISLRSQERRKKSVGNWRRLVRAVKAGEASKAETAMQALVYGSRDAVREMLRARPK